MLVATWGTATVAVVLAAGVWWQWFRRNLNHAAFGDQIARLCHANNADRARRLCSAAPQSPVAVAVKKALEALDQGGDEPPSETVARLREIYVGSLKADLASAQRTFWFGAVALGAIALGVYFIAARDAAPGAIAMYAFAFLILANAWVMARRIAVDGAAQGERLFPIMAATRRPQ